MPSSADSPLSWCIKEPAIKNPRPAALFAVIALAATFAAGPAGAADPDRGDRATLERLRSLEGSWAGRMEDPLAGDLVTVRYEVVSGGQAVIEHQNPGKSFEMVTVYF